MLLLLLLLLLLLFLVRLGGRAEAIGDLVAPGRDEGFVVFVVIAVSSAMATGEREG